MPWRVMLLRSQKVFARCAVDGTLLAEDGRVEIRYRPDDGRAYRAAVRNLSAGHDPTVLADDHCAPAAAAPPSKPTAAQGRARPKAGGPGGKGARGAAKGAVAFPTVAAEGEVVVYADGACSGNPGPAGLGVVMLEGARRRELSEYLGHGTNNIAELTAIQRAAEATTDPRASVRIFTDSGYAIGLLTKGWKAKKNQELVAAVKRALARLSDVSLHHVPGHAGVALNERADQLAVLAVDQRASTGWVDLC